MQYKVLPIDLGKFNACAALLIAKMVRYVFGGKANPISLNPPTLPDGGIDCSGFMRWLVYHATDGKVDIGDGSYDQGENLRGRGLKLTDPANCALEDGHLRICIHHPDDLDSTGHIWAVRNKVTTESYGGHGPGHRAWNARLRSGHTLNQLATLCFVVT